MNIVPYFVSFLTSIFFHLINKHTLQPTFGEDITQLVRALPFFHHSSKILGGHAFLLAIGTEWNFLKHVGRDINRSTWLYPNRRGARPPFRAVRSAETVSIVARKVKLRCAYRDCYVWTDMDTVHPQFLSVTGHGASAPLPVKCLLVVSHLRTFAFTPRFLRADQFASLGAHQTPRSPTSRRRSKGQLYENRACVSFIDSPL